MAGTKKQCAEENYDKRILYSEFIPSFRFFLFSRHEMAEAGNIGDSMNKTFQYGTRIINNGKNNITGHNLAPKGPTSR
ncbi:MAG: hypothetical protein QM642_08480 [Edaphocola sp.]